MTYATTIYFIIYKIHFKLFYQRQLFETNITMEREVNKLLKEYKRKELDKRFKDCIDISNTVGGLYSDATCHHEAVFYHEQALEVATKIGDMLAIAVAHRLIGENEGALGNYDSALDHVKKYLDLTKKLDDRIEIQRAYTTMGRIYLMQAQQMQPHPSAKTAEQFFKKAMKLAIDLEDDLDKVEHAQMLSGLLLNLGILEDMAGQYTESILKLHQAMKICKQHSKLKEDLFRIQIVATGIHRQKNNLKYAAKTSEEAYQTAKSLRNKIFICEALIEKGLVQMFHNDYKAAKRTFVKAYMERSPAEDDHLKAMRMIKVSHSILLKHERIAKGQESNTSLIRLYDKLGDMFTALNLYKKAVDCYKRALNCAKVACKGKDELSRLLYSIAETYADDKQYEDAIKYYQEELSCRKGSNKEQGQTLLRIAHMKQYLNNDALTVSDAYELALEKVKCDDTLEVSILKDYIPYLREEKIKVGRLIELEDRMSQLNKNKKKKPEIVNIDVDESDEEDEDNKSDDNEDEDDADSGGDIFDEIDIEIPNVEDIISEDENNDESGLRVHEGASRLSKKFKANELGESPLHEACIKGDLKRAIALVENGHKLNSKDNYGWTPLHEACNNGHYNLVEFLIEKGADINDRGPKGVSALHDAAANGHWNIMRLLVRNEANVMSLTDKGETVLTLFRQYKKENQSNMSDDDLLEYRQMELELEQAMDRYAYTL